MATVLCLGCRRKIPAGASRCPVCAAKLRRRIEANPRRRARKARLYDAQHAHDRVLWAPIVDTGEVICWRCLEYIVDVDETGHVMFDLGHRDGLPSAPEHPLCNRRAR